MYLHNRLESKSNFFQKIKDVDFILLAGILLLGIISISTMYSTDGWSSFVSYKKSFCKICIIYRTNVA
jgi:hypothetical protein